MMMRRTSGVTAASPSRTVAKRPSRGDRNVQVTLPPHRLSLMSDITAVVSKRRGREFSSTRRNRHRRKALTPASVWVSETERAYKPCRCPRLTAAMLHGGRRKDAVRRDVWEKCRRERAVGQIPARPETITTAHAPLHKILIRAWSGWRIMRPIKRGQIGNLGVVVRETRSPQSHFPVTIGPRKPRLGRSGQLPDASQDGPGPSARYHSA
jgi:hypothetical protein